MMIWFIQAIIWWGVGVVAATSGHYIAIIPCIWLCILSITIGNIMKKDEVLERCADNMRVRITREEWGPSIELSTDCGKTWRGIPIDRDVAKLMREVIEEYLGEEE